MASARFPWSAPGVILFSHGELSYEVDVSHGRVEEWARSKVGEKTFLAYERTKQKRLRPVIVRSVPLTASRVPEALVRMRARLREEARLGTYLRHPGIARIFGCHEVQGVLYVVSEHVEGTSINSLISYSLMRQVLLSPAFCLYLGAQVANALHHAHTCTDERGAPLGIVHRDVNPARIYLEPEGGVMLADFARARSLLPGRAVSTLACPQGEVFYSSPEALLGAEAERRSDLFSLGLVLLELATWRHLYNTAHARPGDLAEALTAEVKKQVLHATLTATAADLPDHAEDCILRAATFGPQDVEELTQPVAHPLRSILRRLLQRKPEDRYPSAAELETDLRAGLAALGTSYGAAEALEEVLTSLDGASKNRSIVEPTSEAQFPVVTPPSRSPLR